ncbi:unnamed protein product [Paramecium primaurelia]|uniref:Transketolase C-terminal domain-containing protein n=1 Tax=Paramecium primaurelia TaxID=5886 RepID=A0A8S1MB31_PARPR|nr:unnamed protein product [Paramecium primaurelia]
MRKDDHVTITAFSKMVGNSLIIAEQLFSEVIICQVFNLRSYRPQNRDNITENAKKIRIEEGWAQSSIRTEIFLQLWNEEHLNI